MWKKLLEIARLQRIWRCAFAVSGGVAVLFVMSQSTYNASAQGSYPTPTALPIVISAQATAQAASANAARAEKEVRDKQRELDFLEQQAHQAELDAQRAQAAQQEAERTALMLNLQETMRHANESARLAAGAMLSVTLVQQGIEQIRTDLPSVVTLTQTIADLQLQLSERETRIVALSERPVSSGPDGVIVFFLVSLVSVLIVLAVVFFAPRRVKYVYVTDPTIDTDKVIDND